MKKKILYVDMDGVLVDFESGLLKVSNEIKELFRDREELIPGIFSLMDPIEGAIKSYEILSRHFDTYILSTSPWDNPAASSDKISWVKKYLGNVANKRLILSHHKNLNMGDYIIDDKKLRGVDSFKGEHIHFGHGNFKTWDGITTYLIGKTT